jgi:hypothetical protein
MPTLKYLYLYLGELISLISRTEICGRGCGLYKQLGSRVTWLSGLPMLVADHCETQHW